MIATLQRSEEGQALVLAAIFGLVLMLCVFGTVNLGRAVYDKVQLQAAADSAAYSQAALEARVMNFTAYTNRAMVVHYASLMAATSYLTWLHFIWAGLRPMLEILSAVPYVGPIAATIENGLRALLRTIDAGIAALAPVLSASNTMLYGLQEAAWHSVWLRLGKPIQPEAHSGDSAAHPYQPLWPHLLPLANQAVFAQARGHLTMPQNAEESLQMLTGAKTDAVRLARLHMLEIANSARQPWVAYGDRSDDPSLSPMARHFKWKLSIGLASLQLGSVARTELGGFSKGSSQVWSAQRLELVAKVFGLRKSLNVLSLVAIDQLAGPPAGSENQYALLFSVPAWLKPLLPGIGAMRAMMSAALQESAPVPGQRAFWLAPYVSFAPQARAKPEPGPAGRLGNFAQPDVVVGLALPARDFNAGPGASELFGRRFTWNGRGAGSAATDFRILDADGPRIPGLPIRLQALRPGLNAFSAAQAYYHRPGDWREMPNLFNPLWSARLMPILESNAAAKLGLSRVPLLGRLLLH
jgi:Putative Flp pilus-assembly TadE/G-like